MAVMRDLPYGRFNYLVEWDGMDGRSIQAGFSEVSGLDATICSVEYRAGNMRTNTPVKIPGMTHYTDVHFKRGIIGSLDLYDWFNAISQGDVSQKRTVIITLLDEAQQAVMRWKLIKAWPVALYGPRLEAEHCAVAIEELVLTHERLEVE